MNADAGNRMTGPLRIAMWSGPRNISTAMMRAWENRGDCAVVDEPLYAAFLGRPGSIIRAATRSSGRARPIPRRVVHWLLGPAPGGKPLWYQKHMAHHLLPGMARDWIPRLSNLLLIRDPAEVVASYVKSRATVAPEDIGLAQQVALYDEIAEATGAPPPVIDSGDFLRAPEAYLRAICAWLDVDFTERMLSWPAGRRDSDGIWAPHWYAAVEASTGFEPRQAREIKLEGNAADVAEACRPHYRRLHAARMALSNR